MMNCTNTEGFKDGGSSALPQTRPCSTVTTIGHKRDERLEKHRRVWFDNNFISDTNSKHSFQWEGPQSPGDTNSYLSLGGGGNSVSEAEDDGTICSSRLYSLHNHNPEMLKEQRKRREAEERSAASNRILCRAGTFIGDILDEVEGTLDDSVKSLWQVLTAFSITPQDIDGIADVIHAAEDELIEIEVDRLLGQVQELGERL